MIESVSGTDFCCFGEFQQDLARQGLVYVRGDHRDSAAANSNGAGKSTLFKAVTWCLFGETVDDVKGDEVIRLGAKEASVTTQLNDFDVLWRVTRTRRKGKPGLKVEFMTCDDSEWEPVKGDRKDLQEKVIELVGLDFRAFKNTVLYGQNDSFKFADPRTKDASRKDMLHRILRTEQLQDCHEVAKDKAKALRGEVADIQSRLHAIDAKAEAIDISRAKERHNRWRADNAAHLAAKISDVKHHKANAASELEEAADPEELSSDIVEFRDEYEELMKLADAAGEARQKHEKHQKALQSLRSDYRVEDNAVKHCDSQLKNLDGDTCPVCTAPLTEGTPHEHKTSIQERRKKAESTKKEISEKAKGRAEKVDKAAAAVRKAEEAGRRAREVRDTIDELKDALEHVESVQARADVHTHRAIDALAEAKRIKALTNPHKEALADARSKVKALASEREELEERRGEAAERLAYAQFWVKGYSAQGLPSFVLDAVMPFLTERTNEYLETLADGDITMSISTQRELKSSKGEVRDEIEISWDIEGNEGVTKSGGQRTRMNLAVDLALMDLAASREGSLPDILMIDEALDGLDKEGTARVLKLLQGLRSRRGSIFVISHSDDMSEMFERGVVVVREDGKSRLEQVK